MIPNLSSAISTVSKPLYFKKVTKAVVDYEAQESVSLLQWLFGNIQPLPTQELIVKPEGQRQWKYWRLFTEHVLALDNEIIDQENRRYRCMAEEDWTQAGFHAFQLAEGVTP